MTDDPIPTLTYEAVKVSMNQTKDGIKITLVIHPNDIPAELLTDPVGSRYRVVMVLLDDHDQPDPRSKVPINEAVKAAVLLAKNLAFQSWMVEEGHALSSAEAAVAEGIRSYCGITSRAELATNYRALNKFNELRLRFSKSLPQEG